MVNKIDIAQSKKLKERLKMIWMNMIKNNMKLLELEEKMVVNKND